MNKFTGIYPAVVHSFNESSRTCEINIPLLTDNSEEYLTADIMFPVGDRSKTGAHSTSIHIQNGDFVYITFLGGDSRYPLIIGFRCPNTNNSTGKRYFHHDTIELNANTEIILNAPKITINGDFSTVGEIENNGKNIGSTHTHSGVETGGGNTGEPN